MADIDVVPKKKSNVWMWVILAIIVAVILFALMGGMMGGAADSGSPASELINGPLGTVPLGTT